MNNAEQKGFVRIDEDEEAFSLQIELMDDRAVTLTYWKNGDPPSVRIWTGNGEHDFEDGSLEDFEDWAKIAIGAMDPARERKFLCQVCNDRQGFGPVLRDEIWDAIAPNPQGVMCLDCMRIRMTACLGRKLVDDDLIDCPRNVGKLSGGAA
jgi:hypothetical protein